MDQRDLEKSFNVFGRCRIDKRVGYAFIEFDDEFNGEDAREELNGSNLGGLQINIEWSKRSGRYNPGESKKTRRDRSRSRDHPEDHRAKGRNRPRSRERDHRRDRLSPDYHMRESWSYSYTMSPKRSTTTGKKHEVDKLENSKSPIHEKNSKDAQEGMQQENLVSENGNEENNDNHHLISNEVKEELAT